MKKSQPASPSCSHTPLSGCSWGTWGQHDYEPVLPPSYLNALKADILEAALGIAGGVVLSCIAPVLIIRGAPWMLTLICTGGAALAAHIAYRAYDRACQYQIATHTMASRLATEIKRLNGVGEVYRTAALLRRRSVYDIDPRTYHNGHKISGEV